MLAVIISLIEIVANDEVKKTLLDINENSIILIVIELTVIGFIAIYSSQKKIKYFCSIFFTSITGGNLSALIILTIFSKITYPNLENIDNIVEFLLQVGMIGAIPSIIIAISLFTRPIKNIEDNKLD